MSKVALITDSTINLPSNLIAEHSITVLPQVLIWSGETYEDGIDIQPEAFYTRLKTAKEMPSTSQVTPKSFVNAYDRLLKQGCEILAILISKKLSGTIDSATQALEQFPGAPIEIVDSNSTSLAAGFVIIKVAEALRSGASLKEARELAERTRPHTGVVFAVNTLEFLHRGGRIGGATRFLGTALNIKPILEVVDGRVEAIERVRTRNRSVARLVELAEERIGGRTPVRIAALHASARSEAEELLSLAAARFESSQTLISEVSPVVGAHAGPGTVGLAWMAGI